MASAIITVNGVPGSKDNLAIGQELALSNQDEGGEVSYLWELLTQPAGDNDAIPGNAQKDVAFIPRKEGSYLLKLSVNLGLPDEAVQIIALSVRNMRTGLRVPAAGETLQMDAGRGWAPALEYALNTLEKAVTEGVVIIAVAGEANLSRGTVVALNDGLTVVKPGLPGQESLPRVRRAPRGGTAIPQRLTLGIVEGTPRYYVTPAQNELVLIRLLGVYGPIALPGTFALNPGSEVHLDTQADGTLLLRPAQVQALSAEERRLTGNVVSVTNDGQGNAISCRLLFNGAPFDTAAVQAVVQGVASGSFATLHRAVTPNQNHPIQSFEYANAAERLAANISPSDVGKTARQLDDGSFWILRAVGSWEPIGGAPWVSTNQVGSGGEQILEHPLGFVPERIDVVPVAWPAGTAFEYALGVASPTEIRVTATYGVTYRVYAYGKSAYGTTGPVGVFTTETRPVADASWAKRFISVQDPGMDEELQYCRQLADGTYAWIIVAF